MEQDNYIITTHAGDTFSKVAEKAKEQSAILNGRNCQFNFNGIECIVNTKTNLDNLYRYYCDAHIMEWAKVGPVCDNEYPADIQEKLSKLKEEWEEERKKKEALSERVAGVEIELKDKELWEDQKKVNADGGYGEVIMRYAENWALLMQKEIAVQIQKVQGMRHELSPRFIQNVINVVADKCSHEADTEGMTGFMYGAAVQELSACWKYGEELRKWHNKEYGHEGEGVVNPAVLTIKMDTE